MWITQKVKNAKTANVFLRNLMVMMSSKSQNTVALCYLQLELEILRIASEEQSVEYKEIIANLRREKKKNDRFTFHNLSGYPSFFNSKLFLHSNEAEIKVWFGGEPTPLIIMDQSVKFIFHPDHEKKMKDFDRIIGIVTQNIEHYMDSTIAVDWNDPHVVNLLKLAIIQEPDVAFAS